MFEDEDIRALNEKHSLRCVLISPNQIMLLLLLLKDDDDDDDDDDARAPEMNSSRR